MSRGRSSARRLFQSILTQEWAIREEWLEQFAGIALRLGDAETATLTADEVRRQIRQALATLEDRENAPAAVAFDRGTPLGDDTRATVRNGVAIIPVMGPLYHYADSFHDVCGCSSYAQIARDIAAVRQAKDMGLAKAALFEVDSAGGEVGGCGETAELIAQLAAEMPTAAYVSDLGASAALWLSVATGHVVVAPSAIVGSIGVVAAFRKKGDSNFIEIVSSRSPKKRPDVETDEGKNQVLATLDALADVFIDAVATYRDVTRETVLSDFGQGDVLVGAHAVEVGLVDRIGTMESLLAEMSGASRATPANRPAARGKPLTAELENPMAEEKQNPAAEPQPVTVDRAYLDAHHPELVASIRAEGAPEAADQATEAERTRIQGVLSVGYDEKGLPKAGVKGFESLVMAAVGEKGTSKAETALRVLNAREAKDAAAREAHLEALKADEEEGAPAPSADSESQVDPQLAALRQAEVIRKGAPQPSAN